MAVWKEAEGVILDLSDLTPDQMTKLIKSFSPEKVKEINDKIDSYISANKTMDTVIKLALFVTKAVLTKGASLA